MMPAGRHVTGAGAGDVATAGAPPATGRLFARFGDGDPAGIQLFCFPYAGGGAQIFRGWQARMPPGVSVTGICLAGREQRFRERAAGTWPAALAELMAGIVPQTRQGRYAFFGHSLGARLAYELAHLLMAGGHRPPALLVVSACRAPGVAPRSGPMHAMPTPALMARLAEMEGVPPEVLANARLMALLEPVLRTDLRLAETWVPAPGRISAPILALCGDGDQIDPRPDMLGWQHHTTAGFAIRSFPAGHFFPREHQEAVVRSIASHLPPAPGA